MEQDAEVASEGNTEGVSTPLRKEAVRHRTKRFFGQLRNQMEFYFSDANLSKNRLMGQIVMEDPNVELSLFLTFNKIKALTSNVNDIVKALRKSDMLEVSEDGTKVRRTTPIREKANVDHCTIYVENLPGEVEHDWLKNVFLPFGNVTYVSIPKYNASRLNKGFAFVEFDTPEAVNRAMQAFVPSPLHFEDLDEAEEGAEEAREEVQEGDIEVKKGRKRKKIAEEEPKEADGLEDKKKGAAEEVAVEECETDDKKRKRSVCEEADDSEAEKKRLRKQRSVEEVAESVDDDEEGERKKKKMRKHKKKKARREEPELDPSKGLHILPKLEWKRLRDKYLSLQKCKMKQLKQHLSRSRWGGNYAQDVKAVEAVKTVKGADAAKAEKPALAFVPGVIVEVTFKEPPLDVQAFKAEARSHSGVLYVDAAPGLHKAHVRCSSTAVAQALAGQPSWDEATVLDGEAETEYWGKIRQDRELKVKGCVAQPKRRGHDKLLRKAEKALGKHIRFDEHE